MDADDFFRDRNQARDDAAMRDSVSRTDAKGAELQRVVSFVIAKLVTGQAISLADEPIRRFFGLPDDAATNPKRYMHRILAAIPGQGLLECPECGGKLKDVAGVLDEKCPSCGATVGSSS